MPGKGESEGRPEEEITRPPEPPPAPAPLPYQPGYDYYPPPVEPAEKKGGIGGIGAIIIPVVLAAVISYGMISYFAAPKGAYRTDITRLEVDLVHMREDIVGLQGANAGFTEQLNGLTGGGEEGAEEAGAYVRAEMLDGYVELSGLALYAKTEDLSDYLTAAGLSESEVIAGLQARLNALEEEEEEQQEISGLDEVKNQVWADLKWASRFQYPAIPIAPFAYSQSISFKVINDSQTDIEDVEISMIIHSRGVPIPFDTTAEMITVTGGFPLSWHIAHIENGVIVLTGVTPSWGDGLMVDAEDSESIFMTINMYTTSATTVTNMFVETEIDNFKIVE